MNTVTLSIAMFAAGALLVIDGVVILALFEIWLLRGQVDVLLRRLADLEHERSKR